MDYGIMITPSLVVNRKVFASGKIPAKSTFEP